MSESRQNLSAGEGAQISALQEADLVLHAAPLIRIIGIGLAVRDGRPFAGELSVEFDEFLLILGYVLFGVNRRFRAFRNADGAVDALIGIDHKKIRTFPEAIHRADVHAVGTLAADAGFADNMRHGSSISKRMGSEDAPSG